MVNKKGQFFILAAIILATIIIGLTIVYNAVNVAESPKKFYSYSDQLNDETGAVVDYSLYSGDNKVADFVNDSVSAVLNSYPDLDVFACYTSKSGELTCDNYGGYEIKLYPSSGTSVSIESGKSSVESCLSESCTTNSLKSHKTKNVPIGSSQTLVVQSGEVNYSIDLTKAQASNNQYYFIFRVNTSAGNILSAQGG